MTHNPEISAVPVIRKLARITGKPQHAVALREALQTLETEGEMIRRVMGDLMGHKNVVVINDEAHHCYREKPSDLEDEDLKGDEKKEAEEARVRQRIEREARLQRSDLARLLAMAAFGIWRFVIGAMLVAIGPISMALFTPAMPEIVQAFGTTEAASACVIRRIDWNIGLKVAARPAGAIAVK